MSSTARCWWYGPPSEFIRWAAALDGESIEQTRQSLAEDQTAYLIPEQDSLEVDPGVLDAVYAEIFERELLSWHTKPSAWPAPRTLAMFREWFELETCTLVADLTDGPLEHERG